MYDHYPAQVRRQLQETRARATAAEAALAALHAGEEPYDDDRLAPTPGQWIWHWNRATPEDRLAMAADRIITLDQVRRCMFGFHEQRLAEYSEALQETRDRAGRDQAGRVAAEDALTRVLRLATTLPTHLEQQINAAIDGTTTQPITPCTGRSGFCQPCRTIHAIPHH